MPAGTLSTSAKRAQVKLVGNDLLRHYGKKRYYTVQEIKDSNRRQNVSLDYSCWSYAAFSSHDDFDTYHRSIGETCDYASMKSDMLSSVSDSSDTSWFDIDLSWLEFPDIDWSIFDFIDFS